MNINGREYSEEELEEIRDKAIQIWNRIKEIVSDIVNTIYESIKDIVEWVVECNPVGYKRMIKREQLIYFESISHGKSNNWRRVHGLPLQRK